MKVTVCFNDGERLEADSEAAGLTRMGFPVSPDEGNNRLAWISLVAIKYVVSDLPGTQLGRGPDPREARGLQRVVLRFLDGEVMRTYQDDSFLQQAEGISCRVWDPAVGRMLRHLVPYHALKAVFFVNVWDSREQSSQPPILF